MVKRFISSLAALVLITGLFSGMPVYARGGDDVVQQPISTTSSSSSSKLSSEPESSTEITNHARDLTEQFKAQAKTAVDDKKTHVEAKTHEQRQKSCEARKVNITKRMGQAVAQAEKHKATFDKIYSNVKAFKTKKNVTVENYDNLVTATDKVQSDSQASITALKDLDVSVDCTSETVAQNLASFQAAVKSTRDSLKTYRESITNLIKAVKSSIPEKDQTSDSQTETKQ